MKTLSKTILKCVQIAGTVSTTLANREADKLDYDARLAYLDGRTARSKQLSGYANKLRAMTRDMTKTEGTIEMINALNAKIEQTVFCEHRLFLERGVEVTFKPDRNGVNHSYMVYKIANAERMLEFGPCFDIDAAMQKVNDLLKR